MIEPALASFTDSVVTLPFLVEITSVCVEVNEPFAMKLVNADVVDNALSTVSVSVTLRVLIPVSNLNVSLFGTVKTALSLPWLSVLSFVPLDVPPPTP